MQPLLLTHANFLTLHSIQFVLCIVCHYLSSSLYWNIFLMIVFGYGIVPQHFHRTCFFLTSIMVGMLKTFKSSLRVRPSESTASLGSSRPHEIQTGSGMSNSSLSLPSTPAHQRTRNERILFDNGHLSPASNRCLKAYGTELSYKFAIPNDALHAFVNVGF